MTRRKNHNDTIAQFEDVDDIFDYIDENYADFNTINFSTCVHRIGKLNKQAKNRRFGSRKWGGGAEVNITRDPRFHKLLGLVEAALRLREEKSSEAREKFNVRECSSILWGLANCGCTLKGGDEAPHGQAVLAGLYKRLVAFDVKEFASQNVSNCIWAIATMHQDDEDEYLPMDVVRALESHTCATMDDFIPQGVSNTLWGFAAINKTTHSFELHPETVRRFGDGILSNIDGFKSMELSNVVWGIATMRLTFPNEVIAAIDGALMRAIETQPEMFSSQSVSNILWAAGNHPQGVYFSERLLAALAEMSHAKFSAFTPQGLSNTLWGFASIGYNPGPAFLLEVREAWEQEGHSYNITESANMLWAFQTLKENPGEACLRMLSRRMLDLPDEDLQVQTIANMMYSLAQIDFLPEKSTMERIEDTCVMHLRRPDNYTVAHGLTNLLWAFGTLRYKPGEEFFAAFNDRCMQQIAEISDQGVSNMILMYATLNHNPGPVFLDALAQRCVELMDDFAPQGVANTIWGWALLDYWPSAELVELYRRRLAGMDIGSLSRIDLVQLFQANLAFETFSKYEPLLTGELLETARAYWVETSTERVSVSNLQREVSQVLTRMGLPHEMEYMTQDKLFSVDITLRGRKVAIEVDGPTHFLRNMPTERVGSDASRHKLMELKGWTVRTSCSGNPPSHFGFFATDGGNPTFSAAVMTTYPMLSVHIRLPRIAHEALKLQNI